MSDIANGEFLFRYAKPEAFPDGQSEIPTTIFNDKELSCDWHHFQKKPEESFNIQHGRSVVIEITVCEEIKNPTNPKRSGELVPDWKQEVKHDPVPEIAGNQFTPNESHSLIKGKKRSAVTSIIRDNSRVRSRL
ncbi:hypothetical protein [Aeromonas dhakensis]|uniref:hypothetical protein n=1 Tax=Aeromonas TaxID=642 RepID=UPI0036726294